MARAPSMTGGELVNSQPRRRRRPRRHARRFHPRRHLPRPQARRRHVRPRRHPPRLRRDQGSRNFRNDPLRHQIIRAPPRRLCPVTGMRHSASVSLSRSRTHAPRTRPARLDLSEVFRRVQHEMLAQLAVSPPLRTRLHHRNRHRTPLARNVPPLSPHRLPRRSRLRHRPAAAPAKSTSPSSTMAPFPQLFPHRLRSRPLPPRPDQRPPLDNLNICCCLRRVQLKNPASAHRRVSDLLRPPRLLETPPRLGPRARHRIHAVREFPPVVQIGPPSNRTALA